MLYRYKVEVFYDEGTSLETKLNNFLDHLYKAGLHFVDIKIAESSAHSGEDGGLYTSRTVVVIYKG